MRKDVLLKVLVKLSDMRDCSDCYYNRMCSKIDPKVSDEVPANPAEHCGNYENGRRELERYRAEIQAEIDEVGYPDF